MADFGSGPNSSIGVLADEAGGKWAGALSENVPPEQTAYSAFASRCIQDPWKSNEKQVQSRFHFRGKVGNGADDDGW